MSARWVIVLPVVALCVLGAIVLFAWTPAGMGTSDLHQVRIAGALLLGAIALACWFLVDRFVLWPLRQLLDSDALHPVSAPAEIGAVAAELSNRHSKIHTTQSLLDAEIAQRERLYQQLQEQQERLAIAVRGSNDGLWEWELSTNRMNLSPRWKGMLGFAEADIADQFDTWISLVFPDDRDKVSALLQAHLAGDTPHFESEHRLLDNKGAYRWVYSRGAALRHASGKAYRVLGLDTDITAHRRMQEILLHLAEGTATATTGAEFFRSLVKHFAQALGVRQAFVTECVNHPTTRVRPLATWENGKFIDDPEYDLRGTPCEEVVTQSKMVFHPHSLGDIFPFERPLGYQSYLGMPIQGRDGKVMGHLAFLDVREMQQDPQLEQIYRIFAARAAAELERRNSQTMVLEIARGLGEAQGEDCFKQLTKSFAHLLGARDAIVTEYREHPTRHLSIKAGWQGDHFADPFDYEVAGSTCEETITQGRICFYPRGVSEYFPYTKPFGWESFLGVPCFNAEGKVIGHVACFHDQPLSTPLPDEAILRLFSERAATELERERLHTALIEVSDLLSSLRGEECFRAMTKGLAQALRMREVFVCECADYPTTKVRMLSRWNRGNWAPCVEFDLAGTSCEMVIGEQAPLYVPHGLPERWPLEGNYGRESYIGLPCFDSERQVIGHIACAHDKPLQERQPDWAILKLFAERASIELERKRLSDMRVAMTTGT